MSDHEVEVGPPTDVFELPQSSEPASSEPIDLKLKIMIGSNFSVELAKSRLSEGSPEVIALLASKYVFNASKFIQNTLAQVFHRYTQLSDYFGTGWRVGGAKKCKNAPCRVSSRPTLEPAHSRQRRFCRHVTHPS